MTLPASGNSISFEQINAEFGPTNPDVPNNLPNRSKLGSYRVSQTVSALTNMPLDSGIPQSGTIKFSDFYNKKLNVVVDETSSSTRVNAKNDYDANNSKVKVIGGFRSRPSSSAGIKVWIHTNGSIGSDVAASSATRNYCSLLTGTWDASTDIIVDIGPSGNVMGAGGTGGKGGNSDSQTANKGSNGGNGTSALGVTITNNTTIRNRGKIAGGGGGGGGGGSASVYTHDRKYQGDGGNAVGGAGGGGGRGFPGGSKGSGGVGDGNVTGASISHNGLDGTDGTVESIGSGGISESHEGVGTVTSGKGGDGGYGSSGETGKDGTSTGGSGGGRGGFSKNSTGAGGVGGPSGYAIIVSGASNQVTITGGTTGDIAYNTAPE